MNHYCQFLQLMKKKEYLNLGIIEKFVSKNYSDNRLLDLLIENMENHKPICTFIERQMSALAKEKRYDELKIRILTILAKPPFSYYKNIKEFAFNQVLSLFMKETEFINTDSFNIKKYSSIPDNNIVLYSKLKTLKQIFRLAVDLNINFLYSYETLLAINKLLCEISKEEEKLEDTPIGFSTYYAGQVQQLIYNDEAKNY